MNFNSVAHLDPEILPIEVDQHLCLRSNPLYGLGLLPVRVKWNVQIAHTPYPEILDPPLAFPFQCVICDVILYLYLIWALCFVQISHSMSSDWPKIWHEITTISTCCKIVISQHISTRIKRQVELIVAVLTIKTTLKLIHGKTSNSFLSISA